MKTNDELVDYLVKEAEAIQKKEVEQAFRKVNRSNFVVYGHQNQAYEDIAIPTLAGQTISQPQIVANMTEFLDVKIGQKILEIGFGSGYQTAILSELIGDSGKIVAFERIKEVYEFGSKNLANYKNVKLIYGDGSDGYKSDAPYDRILVAALAEEFPKELFNQLKDSGKLIVPVINKELSKNINEQVSDLILFQKSGEDVLEWKLAFVDFVPLKKGIE